MSTPDLKWRRAKHGDHILAIDGIDVAHIVSVWDGSRPGWMMYEGGVYRGLMQTLGKAKAHLVHLAAPFPRAPLQPPQERAPVPEEHRAPCGVLASPESFANLCPWCSKAQLDNGRCSVCGNELDCGGYGHVQTRLTHSISCMEVACDLTYLPSTYDWQRVIDSFRKRGLDLDGNERAAAALEAKLRR